MITGIKLKNGQMYFKKISIYILLSIVTWKDGKAILLIIKYSAIIFSE